MKNFAPLILLPLLLLSGCVNLGPQGSSVFTPIEKLDFKEDVYATALFKDTTATNDLKRLYGPEWSRILKKIAEYEAIIESR